jgi:hypothetical protein
MAEVIDPIDRQVKLVKMQIDVLDAIGRYNNAMADAEIKWAKAQQEFIRNTALAQINQQMALALKTLNRHQHDLEMRLEKLEADGKALAPFRTAFKPFGAAGLFRCFEALDRLLGSLDGSSVADFQATAVGATHRLAVNFVAVSPNSTLAPAPDDVDSLFGLMAWMRENLLFFKKGKAAHLLLTKNLPVLSAGIAKDLAALEKRLLAAADTDTKQVEAMAAMIGLPIAAVKPPTKPA